MLKLAFVNSHLVHLYSSLFYLIRGGEPTKQPSSQFYLKPENVSVSSLKCGTTLIFSPQESPLVFISHTILGVWQLHY